MRPCYNPRCKIMVKPPRMYCDATCQQEHYKRVEKEDEEQERREEIREGEKSDESYRRSQESLTHGWKK